MWNMCSLHQNAALVRVLFKPLHSCLRHLQLAPGPTLPDLHCHLGVYQIVSPQTLPQHDHHLIMCEHSVKREIESRHSRCPERLRPFSQTAYYMGVVGRICRQEAMATRPVVTPELYSGEGPFEEWLDHFDSVARINECSDEAATQWLSVRLVGRAKTAYRRLPEEMKGTEVLTLSAVG